MGEHGVSLVNMENMEKMENINQMTWITNFFIQTLYVRLQRGSSGCGVGNGRDSGCSIIGSRILNHAGKTHFVNRLFFNEVVLLVIKEVMLLVIADNFCQSCLTSPCWANIGRTQNITAVVYPRFSNNEMLTSAYSLQVVCFWCTQILGLVENWTHWRNSSFPKSVPLRLLDAGEIIGAMLTKVAIAWIATDYHGQSDWWLSIEEALFDT